MVASASDAAGNAASASDTGAIDSVAPTLTVDAPALTNDTTPTIGGTTDLPAGATVTLTVTDANGVAQTFSATVQSGGTYSADVPSALAEGNYSVTAAASDAAGNRPRARLTTARSTTVAPTLTVDAPALSNDSTPTITGSTNLPAGATITLTVTDALGAVQTFTATVQAGGTYSADVPGALAEGALTVVATAIDGAGNAASANDNGVIDTLAPTLTVDAPALSNDTTPTITGTTNLPAGSTVTLTVTDANGAVQTLHGHRASRWHLQRRRAAGAGPGQLQRHGVGQRRGGQCRQCRDNGAIDITAPTLTVDAPALTSDSTPTISGTSDLPVGSTITLTVTDALGAVQTFTATVQAGGTYSTDVPVALAQGNFSVVATASDAAGNAATASDNGAIDNDAPALTVDAPALTNDSTPTITGTTDLPTGSTITLTVTGANGAVQTFSATVQAGGVYGADVPGALVEGSYSVVAIGSDGAGNSASANDSGAIDLTPPAATITLDVVTADNIVNAGEAAASITLTGTVGGDVQPGDTVTLAINGNTYSGPVQAGNAFSIAVAGADVLSDADRRVDASVSTTDAAGNTTTATAFRDYAVNVAPIAVADTLVIGEDSAGAGADATPGTLGQDSDADGDTLTVIGVAVGVLPTAAGNVGATIAGSWGTLTLAADGSYTYVPLPAAQTLGAGQTESDVFTYTIADGRGGVASATLTVSVNGADDPTVIAGPLTGTVQEDVTASAVGALTATDPETGARSFVAQNNVAGSHGQFAIDSAGNWSYALDNAALNVQSLATGQSLTETFVVATDDGTNATITVTVQGSNDAPVVSSTAINASEEGAAVALGLAVPADVDTGAVLTITVTGLPAIGQVQLADGTPVTNGAALTAAQLAGLRYLPPVDYDGVAAVGSFAYSVGDGTVSVAGGTSITLAAVNDPPIASNANAGTGENTLLNAAVPAANDVDGSVASYALASGVGAGNGSLSFNADGSYSFDPGPDFDNLAVGATRQVSFTYTAIDNNGAASTPATVTITVTGTDDAPVISSGTGSVTEDTSPTATGTLTATDADNAALAFVASTQAGAYGSLTLNAAGAWNYTLGAAAQALAGSQVVTETFTVNLNDGSTTHGHDHRHRHR